MATVTVENVPVGESCCHHGSAAEDFSARKAAWMRVFKNGEDLKRGVSDWMRSASSCSPARICWQEGQPAMCSSSFRQVARSSSPSR